MNLLNKIIIPIKIHFLRKKLKEYDKKFSIIENVAETLCNTTFKKNFTNEDYKKKCLQTMNMSQAITSNRIKISTKIFELQRKLKDG